jgi:hypothetical protein
MFDVDAELGEDVERLRSEDVQDLSDDELTAEVVALHRVASSLEAERLRRVAEVDRRRSFQAQGYPSATAMLVDRLRLDGGSAASEVRTARALERMPETRRALSEGALPAPALRVLTSAREAHPEEFASAEGTLVSAARSLPARQLAAAVAHWRLRIDRRAAQEAASGLRGKRRLWVSHALSGMVRVQGELDPETGESVVTALRAVTDAEARSGAYRDDRTPDQRRADALGEICRAWLDRSDRPEVAGERPHLSVLVDLDVLRGGSGRAELEHTGPIHPEAAVRMACDASVSRVITQGRSEPLEVGRRTPVVPAALRRAVVVRDRHCRFPGCDRPSGWCEPHHVVHWARGGGTGLSNLVLMCRRHHRLVHEGGVAVRMVGGRPAFDLRRPTTVGRAPP